MQAVLPRKAKKGFRRKAALAAAATREENRKHPGPSQHLPVNGDICANNEARLSGTVASDRVQRLLHHHVSNGV